DKASILHHAWGEMTRAYLRDPSILFRNRPLLNVRSRTFHEEGHGTPGAGHAAVRVRSEYPAEADIIRHEEFSSGGGVTGVGPMQFVFIVPVGCLGRCAHNRPVGMVSEEEVRVVSLFLHRLPPGSCNKSFLIVFALNVT